MPYSTELLDRPICLEISKDRRSCLRRCSTERGLEELWRSASSLIDPSLIAEDHKVKVSAQAFTAPEKWKSEKASSSMRAAQFTIPGKEGQGSAECVFYYFGPGAAGGAKANLDRWANQFAKDPKPTFKVEEPKPGAGVVQIVYLFGEGTFMSGPPFGGAKVPKKDYGMAAAVLGTKPGYIFVKMTGPKSVVKAARSDFKKMIESGLK